MTSFGRAPARVGDDLSMIDTPALILDLPAFQANLDAVQRRVTAGGLKLRPHAKAHKCVEIARRQIAAGAAGICCQKVAEAEVFVAAGIGDVLVTNEVVGPRKLDRLAVLARRARIGLCVDAPVHVEAVARAAQRHAVTIDVMIEIDVGQGRCGVADIPEALALAGAISAYPEHLRLRGLQAYHGGAQHRRSPAERQAAIVAAARIASACAAALRGAGHPCDEISGAGTGSYANELASGVYTEVQAGSYVLMDADYAANEPDARDPPLQQALYVVATVISARADRVVVDAGLKALSAESGVPRSGEPGWGSVSISDEHLVLRAQGGGRMLAIGDQIRLVPSHCDPTVNLHDWMVGVAGKRVESVWPVDARGAVA
jgi:D-serine deaminase-like pyridoxal phosphate-dependent protein